MPFHYTTVEDNQIRFKNLMLRSSLCSFTNAYILVKGPMTVGNTIAQGVAANNADKKVIFKNCTLYIN